MKISLLEMQGNLFPKKLCIIAGIATMSLTGLNANAQNFCTNANQLFIETFGTGVTSTSNPDVISPVLTFQQNGALTLDGRYRVINSTGQRPDWHNSPDHTGDVDGKVLVANGAAGDFYSHTVNRTFGFTPGSYSVSLYIMNVDPPGVCGPKATLLPTITFKVEYQLANGTWAPLVGSPLATAPLPQTASPTWVLLGGLFTLPLTGTYTPTNIRITLNDAADGGCGNDFAIDDIRLSQCAAGGALPVDFLSLSAAAQNTGVLVSWSTASEVNNKSFEVERSADGGIHWSTFATTETKGNGNSQRNYAAYDAKPAAGLNLYRVKQVDKDGTYKYSKTVSVKLTIGKTIASVLTNPFVENITVDLLSNSNQNLSIKLYDLAGKLIATDKWSVTKGSSRKTFDKSAAAQKGMYILTIADENNEVLYNGKLIKQ